MANNLEVFVLNQPDGTRRIVAADAKKKAATLLGTTVYMLSKQGETTSDTEMLELAMAEPGAVWMLKPDAKKWVKVSAARKADALPTHGGNRPGTGKPRVGLEPGKIRSLRMDDHSYARYKQLGGAQFLRAAIDANLDLSADEWAALKALGGAAWLRAQMASAKGK